MSQKGTTIKIKKVPAATNTNLLGNNNVRKIKTPLHYCAEPLKLEISKQETSKKMSDTVNDDAESIGRSAVVEASYDLNDDKSIASIRNHGNSLKNFKEESDSFCMIKGVLAALFVLTAVAVGTAAYEVSEKQDAADFEAKVGVLLVRIM
jgi:beta-xylosidase